MVPCSNTFLRTSTKAKPIVTWTIMTGLLRVASTAKRRLWTNGSSHSMTLPWADSDTTMNCTSSAPSVVTHSSIPVRRQQRRQRHGGRYSVKAMEMMMSGSQCSTDILTANPVMYGCVCLAVGQVPSRGDLALQVWGAANQSGKRQLRRWGESGIGSASLAM